MKPSAGDRFWGGIAILIAALVSIPILAVAQSLFSSGGEVFGHLVGTTLPAYVANTLGLMILVGILAGSVGVATAWLVAAVDFPGRRLWSWMLVLPIAAPAYIIAYLYTDLLEYSGPVQSWLRGVFELDAGAYWFPEIRSLPGAALMLSLVLYPYVYLLARASFAAQSRSQFLAARTLGASPRRAFLLIALPGARPAIAGGLALVLMETLADFGVADYFAIPTFSTGIFRTWFALGEKPAAMQLAGVMLVIVVLLVAAEAASRRGRVASDDKLSSGPAPFRLSGIGAVLANLACAVPVLLGFAIPMLLLGLNAADGGDRQPFSVLWGYAWNSMLAASTTALLATSIALLLVYAVRQAQRNGDSGGAVGVGARIATLGYALPGALLAVGLLGPLGVFDRTLTRFARDTFGWDQGLLLSGTIILLVYALIVRFLTVSFNGVSAGMAKTSFEMDAAARSLGAGPADLMRRVHIPLLGPHLAVSASLVFVDVMRELPATLILRPFNFETLATRVYRLASDERLSEASTAAVIIILLGLGPVFVLNRAR